MEKSSCTVGPHPWSVATKQNFTINEVLLHKRNKREIVRTRSKWTELYESKLGVFVSQAAELRKVSAVREIENILC